MEMGSGVASPLMIGVDRELLARSFGRRGFAVDHTLHGHPLFETERLVQLATFLPRASVSYNAGDIDVSAKWSQTGKKELSLEETVRQIDRSGSWVILKRVEQDPEYRALLDLGCAQFEEALGRKIRPSVLRLEAFIFMASPGAVTPFHIDPENTFLLQVRGEKDTSICDSADRDMLTRPEIERFCLGADEAANFKPEFAAHAEVFRMKPGTGVHIPPLAPHWVKNDNNVSVSFAISFVLPEDEARRRVYVANYALRRLLRIDPSDPGRNAVWDGMRSGLGRGVEAALARKRRMA